MFKSKSPLSEQNILYTDTSVRLGFFVLGSVQTTQALNNRVVVYVLKFEAGKPGIF